MPQQSPPQPWPFVEAEKLRSRVARRGRTSGELILETGYGASGLPHIGTFAEVARTDMVRRALLDIMPAAKVRLICFCDDMDGLRKVPDNMPQAMMLAEHLGKPLSAIPDPFGTHASFGEHNGARLREFLDTFGFEYEFLSATECYQSGRFDDALRNVLAHYESIRDIILPTLGEERRATYSPFLPICPRTGKVLLAKIVEWDAARDSIVYEHPDNGERCESLVTGGACKLQWKVDWAMRWVALGVDYEMAGKDLSESVALSSQLCRVLGAEPPVGMIYELFLDERGEKISKSRGNGLSIEEWLRYAPPESLSYYMFQNPRRARRLFFDVVPKAVDEYQQSLAALVAEKDEAARRQNPAWHVAGSEADTPSPVSFALLLNLVAASHATTADILWGFIQQQHADATPATHPSLQRLVEYALAYYRDFVQPHQTLRAPDAKARAALAALDEALAALPARADAAQIQTALYALGKEHYGKDLRAWFTMLYEVLLGQSAGPRFGSFAALYGVARLRALIAERLA